MGDQKEQEAEVVVYLDNNATTPLAPEVLKTINVVLRDFWGNPSSGHDAGIKARSCINEARFSVARMINADPSDIIFTSGGTESNNMLFHSIVSSRSSFTPHVIISNVEHDSVDLTAKHLQELGQIELSVVKVNPLTGMVCPKDVVLALRSTTALVSVMLANNETGVIQPITAVARAVREWERENKKERIFVHTDAAQALGKIPVDVGELEVDYLTVVGHKFYGPRVGALFVKGLDSKATPLVPMFCGGGQERSYRSGTENTGMIAGLGKASELVADNIAAYEEHMRTVRDYLERELEDHFKSRIAFNGRYNESQRIPNTCNISILGKPFQGNHVLARLKHSQASVGAACHSHNVSKASPILMACGVAEAVALNALRVSVGRETTKADVDIFIQDLICAVQELES